MNKNKKSNIQPKNGQEMVTGKHEYKKQRDQNCARGDIPIFQASSREADKTETKWAGDTNQEETKEAKDTMSHEPRKAEEAEERNREQAEKARSTTNRLQTLKPNNQKELKPERQKQPISRPHRPPLKQK